MVEREDVEQAVPGLVVRHHPPETEAAPEQSDPSDREERAANAFDRYSLALQLIQVFPIISVVAEVFVQNVWLARAFAGLGLLAGTVWVIQMERSGGIRPRRLHTTRRPSHPTDLVGSGLVSTKVVGEDSRINISIQFHTTATVLQASEEQPDP